MRWFHANWEAVLGVWGRYLDLVIGAPPGAGPCIVFSGPGLAAHVVPTSGWNFVDPLLAVSNRPDVETSFERR